jgi:hypothetical protein
LFARNTISVMDCRSSSKVAPRSGCVPVERRSMLCKDRATFGFNFSASTSVMKSGYMAHTHTYTYTNARACRALQNTKRKTQNAKRKTQNAKRKTQHLISDSDHATCLQQGLPCVGTLWLCAGTLWLWTELGVRIEQGVYVSGGHVGEGFGISVFYV